MKPTPDCIPCILRQVLNAARKVTDDAWLHRKILNEIMVQLQKADVDRSPAELVTAAQKATYRTLGQADPFAADKQIQAAEAKNMLPRVRQAIDAAPDPLHAAVKLAGAANAYDAHIFQPTDIERAIERVLDLGLAIDDYADFKADLEKSTSILYVLDSAGEVVFDRLLVERLVAAGKSVVCAVRRGPVLNDALREDAEAGGLLDSSIPIVDTGVDGMGVPLSLCSTEFRNLFDQASLVLAKGAANYETLEGEAKTKYFLLSVKCPVVARHFGVAIGDVVFVGD